MAELFHLTQRSLWESALPAGRYTVSTRGVSLAEQGYIHCSLRHQLPGVAERFYADLDDLVVLVIDGSTLDIRYEPVVPGGEEFPHLYGPLPVAAVTAVLPVNRDADGVLRLP